MLSYIIFPSWVHRMIGIEQVNGVTLLKEKYKINAYEKLYENDCFKMSLYTYDRWLLMRGRERMCNAHWAFECTMSQWACRVGGWFLARCVNHSVSTVHTNETDTLITEYEQECN